MLGIGTGSNRLLTWGKWLFTILALVFLINAAWQTRAVLGDILENSLPVFLLPALMAYMAAHLLSPLFASVLLKAIGFEVNYRQTLDLHLRFLPARYLPGGIWHTVARVHFLHSMGVSNRCLSSFVILENLVAMSVTLSVGGVLVSLYRQGEVWGYLALPVALTSILMLILLPIAINRWILVDNDRIHPLFYALAVLVVIVFWFCTTTEFLLFISAFPQVAPVTAWMEIAGAYLFSWGIGFIAVFAPQGVGVFEAVAADLMPATLLFSALVALIAGFRLLVLIADLLMWLSWTIMRFAQYSGESCRKHGDSS